MRNFLILIVVTGGILCLHLLLFTQWTTSRYYMNLAVMFIIAVTLHRGIVYGISLSILVGLAESSVSAIHGVSHLTALAVMSIATWFFSTKLFTTRSALSLLSTTAMATAIYGGFFIASESFLTLLNHQRIHASYTALSLATIVTIITHPIIISFLWRWRKWDRYSQVASPL